MRPAGVSIPMRVMCGVAAALFAYLAVSVAVTGELSIKGNVIEMTPLVRCLPIGVFGLFALVAGWVAATGRE